MSVTVEYYGALADRLGRRRVELQLPNPSTLASLLQVLRADCPDLDPILAPIDSSGSRQPLCAFVVNGRLVPANRADGTPLHDGDRVTLMLLPAGG